MGCGLKVAKRLAKDKKKSKIFLSSFSVVNRNRAL